MWLSPYQDSRLVTLSSASQVGRDHLGVGGDSGVIPFREHAAAGEDGDLVAQAFDDAEVVFHHEDGAALADAADEGDDAVHVLMRHAGGGFIQQQHFGIERQGGGDFERALAAVGELDGQRLLVIGEADILQQFAGPVVEHREHAFGAPEIEAGAAGALQG